MFFSVKDRSSSEAELLDNEPLFPRYQVVNPSAFGTYSEPYST